MIKELFALLSHSSISATLSKLQKYYFQNILFNEFFINALLFVNNMVQKSNTIKVRKTLDLMVS